MTSPLRASTVLSVVLGIVAASLAPAALGQTPCQGTTGPDVIVGDITGPANYSSNSGLEALSFGTTSCNQGTSGVGWHSNNNQHPVIGGELYRFKVVNGAGRFEQVGLSWLKHGFFAESQQLCCTNCQATDGTNLGVGCSDPYTGSRNGTQSLLGPRYQVNPNTGFFTYPPPNPSGTNTGRCQVLISDLEASSPTGTRYFGNCQYIAPDDATQRHGNNNCSYREVTVTGSGTAWSFGFSGNTQREIPAIRAWPTCEGGVTVRNIQLASEGLLILDYKTTPLGGGQYHYEYALYNMNSDDSVRSFSIPIASGVTLTNLAFHDVTYRGGDGVGGVNRDGTDWPSTNSGGTLSWSTSTFAQNQNANAIHWGTTYNFRFDANTAPTAGTVTLGLFKSGGTTTAQTDIPSPGGPPQDSDGDGIPDSSDNCPNVPNPNQADADGDGVGDACDGCPNDPNKSAPGVCGCGVPDTDSDTDGTPDCIDGCPNDPNKIAPGVCGCGVADVDTDHDGTLDCLDGCPNDPNKIAPGVCGCGVADVDTDGDGTLDCQDGCPNDPNKIAPGQCGCGVADTDSDGDGVANCADNCANLPNPGQEDCDGNGIGDVCDLANGAPDCNMNGVIDTCDINSGSSLDFNLDGIPDECQQSGGVSFCFGDGSGAACPCNNSGGPGRGCANSDAASTGALLVATGNTHPDTVVLTAGGEKATALSIFLQGNVRLTNAAHFGDGLRCAGGSLKRIGTKAASAGVVSYPGAGDPSISSRSATLGDPLSPGSVRIYQVYYRDPSGTFCAAPTGDTFNVTQAVQLIW
jgi:hypothetical protein